MKEEKHERKNEDGCRLKLTMLLTLLASGGVLRLDSFPAYFDTSEKRRKTY